jgi:uncharacterized integral membrane protein
VKLEGERWGSPLVREKYRGEKAVTRDETSISIIITIIIILIIIIIIIIIIITTITTLPWLHNYGFGRCCK